MKIGDHPRTLFHGKDCIRALAKAESRRDLQSQPPPYRGFQPAPPKLRLNLGGKFVTSYMLPASVS